jgi:hypothetical protein
MVPLPLKNRFIWCVVSLCLLAAGCERSGGNSSGGHPALPFGDINGPTNGAVLKKTVHAHVAGWVLSEDAIEEVAVYIDRKYVAGATLGVRRPDVAKVYPQFIDSASSGWQAAFEISNISEGTHQLIVQGRSKKGAIADLGKLAISVVP